MRHVARYWEVHRHRMPPATAQRITELRCTGRLSVLRGRVTECPPRGAPERLRVRVDRDGSVTDLAAGWVINATGPGTDLTRTADPLLRDLLGRGLARPDPLRLGLDATPDGAVLDAAGTPSATLFTLGPTLRGIRYETTAIPEIRDQAAALAGLLTAGHRRPGAPRERGVNHSAAAAPAPRVTGMTIPADAAAQTQAAQPQPGRSRQPAQAERARVFRALHQGPDPLLLPNPWDAGSARLLAVAGLRGAGHDERRFRGHAGAPGRGGHPRRGARARGRDRRGDQPAGLGRPGERLRRRPGRGGRDHRARRRGRAGRLLRRGLHPASR